MAEIKIIFDKNGDCTIDAHDEHGGHIKGSAEFTEKLGNELGKVEERHAGGDHHHTKINDRDRLKA